MSSERTTQPATVEAVMLKDDGSIPNNQALPLLVYRGALRPDAADPAAAFEDAFAANGWLGSWRDGIYNFHHYHSTSHEALGVAQGRASVRFGGENGVTVEVQAGDVAILPAGTGHKRLDASPDLLVVGAYPDGRDWDLCRGEPGERPGVLENIRRVPLPAADPVYGADGPLIQHWGRGAP